MQVLNAWRDVVHSAEAVHRFHAGSSAEAGVRQPGVMSVSPRLQPALDGLPASPPILGGRCFLREDARNAGLRTRELRSLLKAGRVRQILHGVYVDTRVVEDLATRVAALDLVRPPDAVIGRRTAAWLRGVDASGISPLLPLPVECIVPAGRTPIRRSGVRCYSAPLVDDVEELGCIPCTTPLRTAVDLLRYLPSHLGLGAADAMAHAGMLQVEALCEEVERWRRGRNVAQARRLASYCEPLAESFGESWLRLRILDAGFPRPEAQIPLGIDRHIEFRLDLGYRDRRVAIEYDGMEYHSGITDRRHDEGRRVRIREHYGWGVLAVGRGEILGSSLAFERAVGELLGLEPQLRRRSW
jgi:hypothetical protein